MKKKVVLCGGPGFVLKFFDALSEKYLIEFVITQFPKKTDRKGNLVRCDVFYWAKNKGIKIYEVEKINKNQEIINALNGIDFVLVFAFGQIISKALLNIPKYGWLNIHPSFLPLLRGPSPLQYALLNNFSTSALSLMKMNEKMDEGNIIAQQIFHINPFHNINAIWNELLAWGPNWVVEKVEGFLLNDEYSEVQIGNATYSSLIKKEDYYINSCSIVNEVLNKIRAFGYVFLKFENIYLKCFLAKPFEIGDLLNIQGIAPIIVQAPGKKIMHIRNFMNGKYR